MKIVHHPQHIWLIFCDAFDFEPLEPLQNGGDGAVRHLQRLENL